MYVFNERKFDDNQVCNIVVVFSMWESGYIFLDLDGSLEGTVMTQFNLTKQMITDVCDELNNGNSDMEDYPELFDTGLIVVE